MTHIYIVEWKPNPKSIISSIIDLFISTGYSHTGIMLGRCYYDLDARAGNVYNFVDLTDPDCPFLKKNGHLMEFYDLGEFDAETIYAVRSWWVKRLLQQPPYSIFRLLTMPFDILRRRFYEIRYRLTGKVTRGIFDLLLPNSDVCTTAVDESLKSAGIDVCPALSESTTYPGVLSEKIRHKRVYIDSV